MPVGSLDQIRAWLCEIEQGLEHRTQHPTDMVAPVDRACLRPLVALANIEHPGMNAYTVTCTHRSGEGADWPEFRATVERLMEGGVTSARFAVGLPSRSHVGAADYRLIGDRASVILVEPANIDQVHPNALYVAARRTFHAHASVTLTMIEADIQNSPAGCAMFSFFLIKKMFKEQDHFQMLHERNLAGQLAPNIFGLVRLGTADFVLPPALMKHTQSGTRLKTYLKARPDMAAQPVNKRGETLTERRMRSLVSGTKADGTAVVYNRAIEEKRRDYVAHLLEKTAERT